MPPVFQQPEHKLDRVAFLPGTFVHYAAAHCPAISRERYLTNWSRDFRPGMAATMPLCERTSWNKSTSYLRSPRSQSAAASVPIRTPAAVSLLTPIIRIGRSRASLTACSFVFRPPLSTRPSLETFAAQLPCRAVNQAITRPILDRRLEVVRCAFRDVISTEIILLSGSSGASLNMIRANTPSRFTASRGHRLSCIDHTP